MIRIVDSLMGSGKTTYFINHINSTPGRYIYVTPYIAECERIQNACPGLNFKQPEREGNLPKMASFLQLIRGGENITTTHELFKSIDDTSLLRDRLQNYTLIMDEVLETLDTIKEIGKADIEMLKETRKIEKTEDNRVIWLDNSGETERFKDVKTIAKRNNLYLLAEDALLMWLFPVEILSVFHEVFILTYMFEASHMKCILDMYRLQYQFFHIRNGGMHEGKDNTDKRELQRKIRVYDRLNELGQKKNSLSKSWYEKNVGNRNVLKLHNNRVNFLQNICGGGVDAALWTCFKKYKDVNTRQASAFCPSNIRAENKYADRYNLAFLINVYDNPVFVNFFIQHGVCPNSDAFALSQLLQWIWRSSIRNGNDVNLYLPSRRMRELLSSWR